MSDQPRITAYGLIRNGGPDLGAELTRFEALLSAFPAARLIIATNDNQDGTDAELDAWAAKSPNHVLLRFDGLARAIPDRIDRLAVVRNLCLAAIREHHACDFMVSLDLDGPNVRLSVGSIGEVIERWPAGAAAVFANQRQAYYDLYALRHPSWCPSDCWLEVTADLNRTPRLLRRLFADRRRRQAVSRRVWSRQYRIEPETPPIAVDSAYGGLGVYRMSALAGCWYGSRLPSGAAVCEHVGLHAQLRTAGGQLYILPWLLNDAPDEHLGPESGAPFPDQLLHPAVS
jgi:hypothetical protein